MTPDPLAPRKLPGTDQWIVPRGVWLFNYALGRAGDPVMAEHYADGFYTMRTMHGCEVTVPACIQRT